MYTITSLIQIFNHSLNVITQWALSSCFHKCKLQEIFWLCLRRFTRLYQFCSFYNKSAWKPFKVCRVNTHPAHRAPSLGVLEPSGVLASSAPHLSADHGHAHYKSLKNWEGKHKVVICFHLQAFFLLRSQHMFVGTVAKMCQRKRIQGFSSHLISTLQLCPSVESTSDLNRPLINDKKGLFCKKTFKDNSMDNVKWQWW